MEFFVIETHFTLDDVVTYMVVGWTDKYFHEFCSLCSFSLRYLLSFALSPQPKEYDSELTCFYYDNHRTPSLVIRPVKVEVVFHKPRIFMLRSVSLSLSLSLSLSIFCRMYHNFSLHHSGILSEREMDRLKELAGPIVRLVDVYNTSEVWERGKCEWSTVLFPR